MYRKQTEVNKAANAFKITLHAFKMSGSKEKKK